MPDTSGWDRFPTGCDLLPRLSHTAVTASRCIIGQNWVMCTDIGLRQSRVDAWLALEEALIAFGYPPAATVPPVHMLWLCDAKQRLLPCVPEGAMLCCACCAVSVHGSRAQQAFAQPGFAHGCVKCN